MFFLFFVFSYSVDETKYRKCADSPFCKRNRNKHSDWKLITESMQISNNLVSFPILDKLSNNQFNFEIALNQHGILHFKIKDQSTYRYDASLEDTIVNQTFILKRNSIEKSEVENDHFVIRFKSSQEDNMEPYEIHFVAEPFSCKIFNTNHEEILNMP